MIRLPLTSLLAAALSLAAPAGGQAADTGWVEVPGGRLYFEAAGSGPPVVLIHGGFGDRRMWDAQFADLARDHRVIRYDHRGFGRSPARAAAYSPVGDLARLLEHLRVDRADLVGNSMGGSLALDFALVHPARVRRLVVVASGANGYPVTPEDIESVVAVFRAAGSAGVDRAAELWLQHPMVAVASRDPATAGLLRTMVVENRSVFRMQHWPDEPLEPRAFARLAEIRAPTLFLLGERDTPLVRRIAEESARRVPGAELRLLPAADHLPQMLLPREVSEAVRAFLARG